MSGLQAPEIRAPEGSLTDLRSAAAVVWRRKWLLLAFLIVIPGATYALSSQQAETFQASAVLQIKGDTVDTSLFTGEAPSVQLPQQPLAAAARLAVTTPVAERVAQRLGVRDRRPEQLIDKLSVFTDRDSGFLTIMAEDHSPRVAANLANAFALSLVEIRAERARDQIDNAIEEVERQLEGLPLTEKAGRTQLSQQLQRLRALRATQGYSAEVVEEADEPTGPSGPRPRRDAALAFVLAGVLGIALSLLLERFDRRVRDATELEHLTGRPLLATIPNSAFSSDVDDDEASEAFQILRASLTYFNIDRTLDMVLVASPAKADGKTTVAANLAIAYARAGRDVILVDTDLRDGQADVRLGDRAGVGLGAFLVGEAQLPQVLVPIPVPHSVGSLRLLPGGPPPPNPSELIGSNAMRELLALLIERCDMVIVDTPAGLVVGDALPLFEQASGIVLVGRVNVTTRDAVIRLRNMIDNTRGTLLGVVATGGRAVGSYGYGGYGPRNRDTRSINGEGPVESVPTQRPDLTGRLRR